MPSKARSLMELTRIHWFPVGSDFMFWPFGKSSNGEVYVYVDYNSAHPAWGYLAAAYHVALPMSEVLTSILFYALLGTLIHSAGCVINDMLDREFDRKVGKFQSCLYCYGILTLFNRTFEEQTHRVWGCYSARGFHSSGRSHWHHLLYVFDCWY